MNEKTNKTGFEKSHFKVDGLDCADEVAILQKDIGRKAGIINLECNVITGKMTVTYDPEQITAEQIIASVSKTGMEAEPWAEQKKESDKPFWVIHGRFIAALLSGLLLVSGFCVHWFIHGNFLDALIGAEKAHPFPLPSIVLYVGAVIAGSFFVIPKVVIAARKLRPDMNLLMITAIAGAMAIGDWLEAATIAFLFAVALLLEHWSVERARRAIDSLINYAPAAAWCIGVNGELSEKPVDEIGINTIVLVRPGDKIPLDGFVVKGTSRVNQAPITGESKPVHKEPGNEVFAGTINEDGAIEFKVSKRASDTTLARIIHLIQEAQSHRAPAQQWVDSFAAYYTPVMILLSVLVFVVPPLLFGGMWTHWLYRGLVILVIACPCALVISTPVSIVSALTSAVRNGVLIKGGRYLELAGHIKAMALDKTGTLTYGQPEVQEIVPFNSYTGKEVLESAAALEFYSEHPLARAILRRAGKDGVTFPLPNTENFQAIKGKGAQATVNGRLFWVGSHRLMHEKNQEIIEAHNKALELEDAGHSVVMVGNDHHLLGLISIADGVREKAREVVADLKTLGVKKIVMLTGDNEGTAKAVGKAANVDEVRAELLPEDKVMAVRKLVDDFDYVGMVGDGINDAPAMAASTVGIAMGAMGTDTAIETSDIALMTDDLTKLPWLIEHSQRTLIIIKQNIAFSLGLKILFIIMGIAGIASLWMAIAADMGASLIVIFNGLRLLNTIIK